MKKIPITAATQRKQVSLTINKELERILQKKQYKSKREFYRQNNLTKTSIENFLHLRNSIQLDTLLQLLNALDMKLIILPPKHTKEHPLSKYFDSQEELDQFLDQLQNPQKPQNL